MRAQPMLLTVKNTERLTPNMQRLVLGGDDLAGFPENSAGDYVKLMFQDDGQPVTNAVPGQRPLMRTYTVQSFNSDQQTIAVDFALHGLASDGHEQGVASQWSVRARPGEQILVGGPGPGRGIVTEADWFLLAGDMTALPALSVQLASLPAEATGFAVIEVSSLDDAQPLDVPPGIEVFWVADDRHDQEYSAFVQRVRTLPWKNGEVSVWAACEFSKMRQLRHYLKQERHVATSRSYISSYWKQGASEDQHKRAKKEDASAQPG